mmetsp:Transcript_123164/g.344747  ORF Transcript_123164/g.344747 Transcript_123164/m.344747 type:complete len:299 (-) Transcript_123164:72-968(-)
MEALDVRRVADDQPAEVVGLDAMGGARDDLHHRDNQDGGAQLHKEVGEAAESAEEFHKQVCRGKAQPLRLVHRQVVSPCDASVHELVQAEKGDEQKHRHDAAHDHQLGEEDRLAAVVEVEVLEERDVVHLRCHLRVVGAVTRWRPEGEFEQLERGDDDVQGRVDQLEGAQGPRLCEDLAPVCAAQVPHVRAAILASADQDRILPGVDDLHRQHRPTVAQLQLRRLRPRAEQQILRAVGRHHELVLRHGLQHPHVHRRPVVPELRGEGRRVPGLVDVQVEALLLIDAQRLEICGADVHG